MWSVGCKMQWCNVRCGGAMWNGVNDMRCGGVRWNVWCGVECVMRCGGVVHYHHVVV